MSDSYAVVAAARNEKRHIGKAISAVPGQSLPPDMVVFDDGSTDGTPEILRGTPCITTITNLPREGRYLHDPKMKAVGNKGFAAARSKCRYALNMDGDITLSRNYSKEVDRTHARRQKIATNGQKHTLENLTSGSVASGLASLMHKLLGDDLK